jgi:hypothetical protein
MHLPILGPLWLAGGITLVMLLARRRRSRASTLSDEQRSYPLPALSRGARDVDIPTNPEAKP